MSTRLTSGSDHPVTSFANPIAIRDELDYEEIIVLSGMFRRWALYEPAFTSEQRTNLIAWSADFERIAAWVGQGWIGPSTSSSEMPLLRLLAQLERDANGTIDLLQVKHWLGTA